MFGLDNNMSANDLTVDYHQVSSVSRTFYPLQHTQYFHLCGKCYLLYYILCGSTGSVQVHSVVDGYGSEDY